MARSLQDSGEVNYEIDNTEPGKKRHRVVYVNNLRSQTSRRSEELLCQQMRLWLTREK